MKPQNSPPKKGSQTHVFQVLIFSIKKAQFHKGSFLSVSEKYLGDAIKSAGARAVNGLFFLNITTIDRG